LREKRTYRYTIAEHLKVKITGLCTPPKAVEPDIGYFHWDPEKKVIDQEAIKHADILINLAGTSIADSRWTARQKRKIINSRIFATDLLTQTLLTTPNKITAVINASATGIYGHTDNRIIREESFLATDFLGLTCRRWEDAAIFKKSGKRLASSGLAWCSEDGGFQTIVRLKFCMPGVRQ
jgi:hypothetical protein